jgi:hypothetical protein
MRCAHTLCAFLALLTLLVPAHGAGGGQDSATPVALPVGIADAAGKTGFLPNASGGIDAVNLENGELLWDTKLANRPLVAFEQKLAAYAPVEGKANQVRVLVFDGKEKGKKVAESDPVELPEWVATGLTHGRSFHATGKLVKGELHLAWEARAWYAGGARPTREIEERARKHAAGVAVVNLESGKVTMKDAEKADTPKIPAELEKVTSSQYFTGKDWLTKPIVAGNTLAALEVKDLGMQKQKMTLKRWDLATGKELPAKELLESKALWSRVQEDGRYLFVHPALVKEQLPEGDYAWFIFSLETGERVSKIPFGEGGNEMSIAGGRLYQIVAKPGKGPGRPGLPGGPFQPQPRLLRAFDLKTGKQLWEHEVEPVRMLPPLP